MNAPTVTREEAAAAVSRAVDAAVELADEAFQATKSYLASEKGRKLRCNLASAVIIGAPMLSQLPLIRRSPAARLLRTAAVGTLLVKGAEWLRDWEPGQTRA